MAKEPRFVALYAQGKKRHTEALDADSKTLLMELVKNKCPKGMKPISITFTNDLFVESIIWNSQHRWYEPIANEAFRRK